MSAGSGPSVGTPLSRVDGPLKVTGAARYAAETPTGRLVHGVLVQSTVAAGRIRRIDTASARRAPGVLLVLTHLNAPRLPQGGKAGAGIHPPDVLTLLQDDEVYYNGQPIAVVVADTLERATEAATLVRVSYDARRPVLDAQATLSRARTPKKIVGQEPDSRRGNVEAGLSAAEVRVEQTYTTPLENHNPMETHATIAAWEGGRLTLHDSTQHVDGVREFVSKTLALPLDAVRVLSPFVGGAFGGKGTAWSHVVLAAMAAKQVGRPVKIVLSRRQMFGPVGGRPITIQQVTLGARRDGTLTGIRHRSTSTTSELEDWVEGAALATRILYACPNVETSHRVVTLNVGTPTYQRAPGESTGTFALESAVDELAGALDMDPLALRLANYAERDPESGNPWSSKSLRECYHAAADRFEWSRRSPKPRSMREGDELIGFGMATATYPTRRQPASASVRLEAGREGVSALVRTATHELGTGTYTVMTQVAADALGLAPEQIRFELGDTRFPPSPISAGSMTAASTGSAVYEAARLARQRLIRQAIADRRSPLAGAPEQEIRAGAGRLVLAGDPSKAETYQAALARSGEAIEARADVGPGPEADRYSMHAFGAVFAEVRVDPSLGTIRIPRIVGAYAAGRVLNPKTARSQLSGGVVWGVGMALLEETMLDPRTGRVVNADLAEYLVPVNADVGAIDILLVDETDPHVNPIGVKGIGEIGITGVAAAVANAVYHATGVRVRDLPITLDKLLTGLAPEPRA